MVYMALLGSRLAEQRADPSDEGERGRDDAHHPRNIGLVGVSFGREGQPVGVVRVILLVVLMVESIIEEETHVRSFPWI